MKALVTDCVQNWLFPHLFFGSSPDKILVMSKTVM